MAEIEWVKLAVNLFDNPKIKYIRSLPKGGDLVLIWIQLILKAGQCNEGGALMLTAGVPYNEKMLAQEFGFPAKTMGTALNEFEKLNMVERVDGCISLPGWAEHQNVDGMEKIREQARERKRRQRERERDNAPHDVTPMSRDSSVTVTEDVTPMSREVTEQSKNKNKSKNTEEDITTTSSIRGYVVSNSIGEDVRLIQRAWNDLECPKVKQVLVLSDEQRMKLEAALELYGTDELLEAVEKVKASDFLSGRKTSFAASFDWWLENLSKILSGKYDEWKQQSVPEQSGDAFPETMAYIRQVMAGRKDGNNGTI